MFVSGYQRMAVARTIIFSAPLLFCPLALECFPRTFNNYTSLSIRDQLMSTSCFFAVAKRFLLWTFIAFGVAVSGTALAQNAEQLLNAAMGEQAETDSNSKRSQIRVAQLSDEGTEFFGDYRVTLQQLDRLKIYNGNLERLVRDQDQEKSSIGQQLEDFTDVEQGVVPLMYELIASLKSFVGLDMPFSPKERRDRVQRLEDNMDRSDLTVSEKYRQIMDAYQIEVSFGRNIETYPATLNFDGVDRKVDILRVGRVLLAYQTSDQSLTGHWDKVQGTWVELDDDYRRSVADGIKIAKKQAAPTLLKLPISAARSAQ
jgi:hypothetical protein